MNVLMTPYQPREGSLPDKVLGWLEHNPGGLTAKEISKLFDVPPAMVQNRLHRALRAELLVYTKFRQAGKVGRPGYIYTLPEKT